MNKFKIALSCDHAGFKTKEIIIKYLISQGYQIKDYGCFSEESVDYTDFAHPMAKSVDNKTYDLGIALCGSGNGINMTSNKYQGVRSALCWTTEISELARQHNDANVCSIPARFVSEDLALEIVKVFLATPFEGGRHQKRIDKIPLH